MIPIKVRAKKGNYLVSDYIRKRRIPTLLKSGYFSEIRVKYEDITLEEAENIVQRAKGGISVHMDGDKREAVFRLS